jgi:DNA invertase Pin-like site-specific DNA recombinase
MNQKHNLAVYCRVSTLDAKKNETIARQLDSNPEKLRPLLKSNGGQYNFFSRSPINNCNDLRKTYFCDEAYNLEEFKADTALAELMDLIKAGEIQAILADTEDRLFRSKKRMVRATLLDLLEEHDVKIYTHQGETPHGMLLDIKAMFAAEDKKAILRKLQQGKIAKMKRGGGPMNNRQPFGYRWKKKEECWQIVEDEAKVIRWAVAATAGKILSEMPEAIRMLIDQHKEKPGVPDLELIDAFASIGINMRGYYLRAGMVEELDKNPGGKLHEKFIYTLLRDRKYIGGRESYLTPADWVGKGRPIPKNKKVAIEMNYPALVLQADWEEMEAARRLRAKFYGKNIQHDYLVKDLIVCGACDARMQSASSFVSRFVKHEAAQKKYRSFSYKCTNRKPNAASPCSSKNNHKSQSVDEAVWRKVKEYILDPEFILLNEKTVREDVRINNVLSQLESELKAINFEAAQIAGQEQRMLLLLARATITEEQFRNFSSQSNQDAQRFRRAKQKVMANIDSKKKLLRNIDRVDVEKIRSTYKLRLESLSFDERRSLTLRVVRRVVLSEHEISFVDFYLPTTTTDRAT